MAVKGKSKGVASAGKVKLTKKMPEPPKEKSGLWVVLIIFFFMFGFFSPAIAVELTKLKVQKDYADFEREEYNLAIFYTIPLGIAFWIIAAFIGFWLSVGFYLIIFLIAWLSTRGIKKSETSNAIITKKSQTATTDVQIKTEQKTFSIWAFFGGLVVGYILFGLEGLLINASILTGLALLGELIVVNAIIVIFCVLVMDYGISNNKYAIKSLAIGMLGLIIGLVAEYLIKKSVEGKKSLFIPWLVTTILVVILILALAFVQLGA